MAADGNPETQQPIRDAPGLEAEPIGIGRLVTVQGEGEFGGVQTAPHDLVAEMGFGGADRGADGNADEEGREGDDDGSAGGHDGKTIGRPTAAAKMIAADRAST